jgi:hypothetical protein
MGAIVFATGRLLLISSLPTWLLWFDFDFELLLSLTGNQLADAVPAPWYLLS